ncbi:hypothetical protein WJX72_008764 [[Myrmecia] bisecta]|uniref:Uncharacterized protein n=1 Tax=[Myrmecia] bisecta TaxID=41462 RepID=A0AAW1Q2P4_9CHLO
MFAFATVNKPGSPAAACGVPLRPPVLSTSSLASRHQQAARQGAAPISTSDIRRKQGNEAYLLLLDGLSPAVFLPRWHKAFHLYDQARQTAKTDHELASALRNCGQVFLKRAQHTTAASERQDHLAQAAKHFTSALDIGARCNDQKWLSTVEAALESCVRAAVEELDCTAGLLKIAQAASDKLPHLKADVWMLLADAIYKRGISVLETEPLVCLKHMHEAYQPVEEALRWARKAHWVAALLYLEELQHDIYVHQCISESIQERLRGDALLASTLSGSEDLDMEAVWLVIDAYKQAAILTREHAVDQEAMALGRLGVTYDKLVLGRDSRESATRYLKKALELANTLHPVPAQKPWFLEITNTLLRFQQEIRQREEQELRLQRGPLLKELKDELVALDKAADKGVKELVDHIYKTHPPKNNKHVKPDMSPENMKKGLLTAVSHYHPDRQRIVETGAKWPAKVQGMLIPKALEGRNVVLAAETGSGKTLAYLLPIIDQLLAGRRQSNGGPRPANWVDDGAVVLCPNAALCEQVVAAANALTGPDGEPLAKALYVSSRNPPPKWSPDILVATPAGLMGMTQEYGGYYGWEWTKTGVVTRMRIVVADEADLLMEGSYARDLQRILAAFKEGDRNHGVLSVCRLLGMEEQQFLELPRHMRKAAQEGGLAAMVNAGFVPPRPLDVEGWDTQPVASTSETLPPRDWKRQYIFVAATMPSGAGKSVKADLQRLMPDAVWLNSMRLHYAQRGLTHHWVAATEDMWRETLQDVVAEDTMLRQGKGRMLVFASNVAAAINVAEALQEVGVRALLYHREVPVAERAAALETMSAREGVVLVCTDAAARGIDIAKVTHVVQADFASSAIDFLHRVGRTARAGRDGHVTSIYGPENEPLVDAIREAILAGEPVEGAFSRNRSFRKKYRRYGKFVPRGATAGQQ